MPNPFQYFKPLASVLQPLWAVDTLTYQIGPATFLNGLYFQTVDISAMAVTKEYATALLATFQKLGWKQAAGLSTLDGVVITYAIIRIDPADDRDTYNFVGVGNSYGGDLAGYYAQQSAYNDVNGGGVGSPGAWTLPAGAPEPVWVPAVYTPPSDIAQTATK